jgi:3-hydroxyphenylacetate 6-hydroxylase
MSFVNIAAQHAADHPVLAAAAVVGAGVAGYITHVSSPTQAPDLPGPKGLPIVGSLFQRGFDPAETYRQWAEIYGPVYRVRLGNSWVVVVNSADAADEIMAHPQFAAALQSRTIDYSLGKLIAIDPRTITVASSPFSETLKKKRTLAIEVCQLAALPKYADGMAWCVKRMIRDIWAEAKANDGVVDPWPMVRDSGRNIAHAVHFGTTIEETHAAYDMYTGMRDFNS